MKLKRKFRTVYIDPPWPERGGGKIKRGADKHYPTMTVPEINAVVAPLLQARMAKAGAHLYMWATNNYLEHALLLMRVWGYRYITPATWFKGRIELVNDYSATRVLMRDTSGSDARLVLQMGLGQYYRGVTEHCLFGVRGRIPYRLLESGKRAQGVTGFLEKRTDVHSQKPKTMREMIERVSPPPYLELFAREPHTGWTVWGNEV